MVNPYTVQTGIMEKQDYLAQSVTCKVDVRRNPARHRPNLKRLDEADHFSVTLNRSDLEDQGNECLYNALIIKVPFKDWQKVEWWKTFTSPLRIRTYTYDQITPNQEAKVRDAVYSLKWDLLASMNMNAPRPEYSLVIYTR